jgi:tRNA threonylcarbamoyladenosine biosynthesis protein TsaE
LETQDLGKRIGEKLKIGSVVALYGGLGAGKTCLTKGIAIALGVTEPVTSPTYTIICQYGARIGGTEFPLYHMDAYRLSGDEDFENTGATELLGKNGIAVIEWSERIPLSIPENAVRVEIEITEAENRIFSISGVETLQDGFGT